MAIDLTPVRDSVSDLLDTAEVLGASHVHFDPAVDAVRVRFRIGGQLRDAGRLAGGPVALDDRIADRGMTIAAMGARIVVHLPARESASPELEALGMNPALARAVGGVESGLVVVAGPAGCGRSTTLAALRDRLDDGVRNLMVARDAGELRAVLKQDADAILIDSLADRERVTLAMQAAEAGHLVLAGVDASDAVSAILRLRELRAEPFQLASTLKVVIAQRLVRRLCGACRVPVQAQGSVSSLLGFDPGTLVWSPGGCETCEAGYAGRIAVFEAIVIDGALRRLINDRCDGAIIARHAFLNAPNLGAAARILVREGVTTPEEAMRVSRN